MSRRRVEPEGGFQACPLSVNCILYSVMGLAGHRAHHASPETWEFCSLGSLILGAIRCYSAQHTRKATSQSGKRLRVGKTEISHIHSNREWVEETRAVPPTSLPVSPPPTSTIKRRKNPGRCCRSSALLTWEKAAAQSVCAAITEYQKLHIL